MNTDFTLPEPGDATDAGGDLPPRPWERQPGESTPAWAAFRTYRDIGPRRSLDAVAIALAPPAAPEPRQARAKPRRNGSLSDWSRRHDWVARAAAWDAEVDREGRVAHIEAVKAMNERHAEAARALQTRALEALQAMPAADLATADVLRFLVEACKLERLAVGEVTERSAQEIKGGPLVLEIVERIVPVRGGDQSLPPAAPGPAAGDAAPVTHRLVGVVAPEDQGDATEWELPDEPPEFLRRP